MLFVLKNKYLIFFTHEVKNQMLTGITDQFFLKIIYSIAYDGYSLALDSFQLLVFSERLTSISGLEKLIFTYIFCYIKFKIDKVRRINFKTFCYF